MKITYHSTKREKTLTERGLDFEDAARIFEGRVYEYEDIREDYGERRIMCFGMLDERMVVVGYVQRGEARHVFSMRKANEREIFRFKDKLEYG
ncbi:MAG: BrnT family toxin [Magnetococcales bacterium]|nr:BrnT family toxin [Magnetococcales bacterium]